MDFLNSLDLDPTNRKSRRMRSWYLYEQYKSLEKNQLDAAERLKERSYQEKILRQELSERKARRKLYDRFGLSESEPGINNNIKSAVTKSNLSASSDDFFESFCELRDDDEEILTEVTDHDTLEDTLSYADSITPKPMTEDFKSFEEPSDDNSCAESVKSVVEQHESQKHLADELKKKLAEEVAKIEMAENITAQFEEVKKSIQCIEELANLSDEDETVVSSEDQDRISKMVDIGSNNSYAHVRDNNISAMWTRLVSFAYQVTQLSHGNCYYDYSSQFLTAVLACDVLRRGVSSMCDILQPYVSPIKYATDDRDASIKIDRNEKRKKSAQSKKYKKTHEYKSPRYNKYIFNSRQRCISKKPYSEDYWRNCSRHPHGNRKNDRKRIASEPVGSIAKLLTESRDMEHSSCDSIWPDFSKETLRNKSIYCCNYCHKSVSNPMLKISRYIDSIMQDIEACKRM